MSKLSLSLLGPVEVTYSGQQLYTHRATKVVALLIYLALNHDHIHKREQLLHLLWPDLPQKSAQASLRQTLYRLRKAVPTCGAADGSADVAFLQVDRHTVRVNPAATYALDIATFTALQGADTAPDATRTLRRLEQAAAIYRGDFLTDFYLPDSNVFEAWASGWREKFRRQALALLGQLTTLLAAQGKLEDAEFFARRQLDFDDLRESGHRQLMEILARRGRRRAALSQYERCRQQLTTELGVSPSAQTIALAEAIRAGELDTPVRSVISPSLRKGIDLANGAEQRDPYSTSPPHGAIPNNLPQPPAPFVGRQTELEELSAFIADPQVRLVTIVGPGGIGKTRLALVCAEQTVELLGEASLQKSPFPDGVYFVALAPLRSREQMIPALAEALEFPIRGGAADARTPEKQILDFLQDKQLLLVLDNFEHLLDGCDLIQHVLETAPGTQFLITSRERLHLHVEQVYPIQGLDFPDEGEDRSYADFAAVQLFLQSAHRIQPGFGEQAENLSGVARLCRQVEGLPLAIELAASWVDTLSVADIAGEIEQSLELLETEMRDFPQRHRSFRAAMDTSWQLLDSAEQATFAQLTVFRGGFSREAAEAVVVAGDSPFVLKRLSRLVNKSWLRYNRDRDRYQIHELLRQYGAEKLAKNPAESTSALHRHANYFCTFLDQREPDLKGGRQVQALEEIEGVYEELEQVWTWAAQSGRIDQAAQMMFSLGSFYGMRGRIHDGERAFDRMTESITRGSTRQAEGSRVLAALLTWQASFCSKLKRSRQLLTQAHALLDTAALVNKDVRWDRAFAYLIQGWVAITSSAHETRSGGNRSLALFREVGDPWGIAAALNLLGQADVMGARYDRAREPTEEALRLCRENGNQFGAVESLLRLSYIAIQQGDFVTAEQFVREILAMHPRTEATGLASQEGGQGLIELIFQSDPIRHPWPFPSLMELPGLDLLNRSGQYGEAYRLVQESLALEEKLGNRHVIAQLTTDLGFLSLNLGMYQQGRELAEAAFALCSLPDYEDEFWIPWTTLVLGIADLARGAYASARQRLREALDVVQVDQFGLSTGIQTFLGRVELALGNLTAARKQLFHALHFGVEMHSYVELLEPLPFIALALAETGERELAVEVYALSFNQPMIGNSQLFADIAGNQLEEVAATLPAETAEAAKARGRSVDLWQRATLLLEELVELGWKDS